MEALKAADQEAVRARARVVGHQLMAGVFKPGADLAGRVGRVGGQRQYLARRQSIQRLLCSQHIERRSHPRHIEFPDLRAHARVPPRFIGFLEHSIGADGRILGV